MTRTFLPLIFLFLMGFGLISPYQGYAETSTQNAEALKHLVQDIVSHDVRDFVTKFYNSRSRRFVFLDDEHWAIEHMQNGNYIISVHIESYRKDGKDPLGRDILTIKIDPRELHRFFESQRQKDANQNGIHIVQCSHQDLIKQSSPVTFSAPKQIKGKFCR